MVLEVFYAHKIFLQHTALLETEGVKLKFGDDTIRENA
jgi:hypothetical protein